LAPRPPARTGCSTVRRNWAPSMQESSYPSGSAIRRRTREPPRRYSSRLLWIHHPRRPRAPAKALSAGYWFSASPRFCSLEPARLFCGGDGAGKRPGRKREAPRSAPSAAPNRPRAIASARSVVRRWDRQTRQWGIQAQAQCHCVANAADYFREYSDTRPCRISLLSMGSSSRVSFYPFRVS